MRLCLLKVGEWLRRLRLDELGLSQDMVLVSELLRV